MSAKAWRNAALITFIAVIVIGGIVIAANAADTILSVPSDTRTSSDQLVFRADTGHAGETCKVIVTETNEPQPSEHEGNQLLVRTGEVSFAMAIERQRGGGNEDYAIGVVGAEVTLTWLLGDDGVSSAGGSVSLECAPPETTTTTSTTSPSTTTTETPSTTTTVQVTTTSSPTPTTVHATTTTTSSLATTTTATDMPPIPTGVPTGSSGPPSSPSPVGPLTVAGLAIAAIGAGSYKIARRT